MKKLMTLMLGTTIVLGSTALFAYGPQEITKTEDQASGQLQKAADANPKKSKTKYTNSTGTTEPYNERKAARTHKTRTTSKTHKTGTKKTRAANKG